MDPGLEPSTATRGSPNRRSSLCPSDKLTIGRALGAGRFGRVYQARYRGADVAAKVVSRAAVARAGAEALLASEVALHSGLKHPHILELVATVEEETRLLILLELAPGGSLEKRLGTAGPARALEEAEARRVLRGLTSALAHCHASGIVHRDVKPDNLLFSGDGRPLLSDFGMAVGRAEGEEGEGVWHGVCGTTEFLAPEMLAGCGYSYGVDVWALGIVAHELLAGHTPFSRYEEVHEEEGEGEGHQQDEQKEETQHSSSEGSEEGGEAALTPHRHARGGVAWEVPVTLPQQPLQQQQTQPPRRVRYQLNTAATLDAILGRSSSSSACLTGEELTRLRCAAAGVRPPAPSPAARAFLDAVLVRDPAARPSAAQLLRHEWLAEEQEENEEVHALSSSLQLPMSSPVSSAPVAAAAPVVVPPPPTPGTKRRRPEEAEAVASCAAAAPTPSKRPRLAGMTPPMSSPGARRVCAPRAEAENAAHFPLASPATAGATAGLAGLGLASPMRSGALRVPIASGGAAAAVSACASSGASSAAVCGGGSSSIVSPRAALASPLRRLGGPQRVPVAQTATPRAQVPWKL